VKQGKKGMSGNKQDSKQSKIFNPAPRSLNLNEIIKLGIKNGYLRIKDNRIEYTYSKKEYNFTDPEEKVRAATYVNLIENYQYSPKRMDIEVFPPRREPKLPADIVVFEDDEHEHCYLVVEAKATSEKNQIEEAKREGLGNSNLLDAKYLLVVCGDKTLAYDVTKKPALETLDKYTVADIPKKYGKVPKYKYRKGDPDWELKRASFNELSNKFQLCHDEIWEGGKRDPAIAFDEISKLMFSKIYDERFTPAGEYYKFQIGTFEDPAEVARRITKELYKKAQEKEPEVFRTDIELPPEIIFRVVEVLQDISLIHTDLDAKGRAFENFLGTLFRGEYGQYFTRREIVQFMVSMLDPDEHDLIIDPACGSGGFLLYSLELVRNKIKQRYRGDQRTIDRIDWDFAHNQIFGIEVNDRIARVAMMDMVIHDDGHSNIEIHDALDDYRHFDKRKDIRPGKYSILLTNPPFGAFVKDERILKNYELGKDHRRQRTEILFIERCLDLLRPGGCMGIVLPDGILTNTSLQYVRDFIRKKAKILAVISLPQTAFVPAGSGVKASLLFLEKKRTEEEEEKRAYPIFMAIVEHIGYDATGRPDTNDLPSILEKYRLFKRGELR
jgi:type I restriction enzyme M protein